MQLKILTGLFTGVTILVTFLWSTNALSDTQSITSGSGPKKFECKGKYKGIKLDPKEVNLILQRHKEWLRRFETFYESSKAKDDSRRANLCGANLAGVTLAWSNLRNADLRNAILRGSDLRWADLRDSDARGADFTDVNLRNSDLRYAALTGAKFSRGMMEGANSIGADFRDTDLTSSTLTGANLSYANFADSNLENAHLAGATMSGTNLQGANLRQASLSHAIFEPIGLPSVDGVAKAYDLEKLRFEHSPRALSDLRVAMKEAGNTGQAKAITAAINHGSLWRQGGVLEYISSTAKFVFFELPTNWGMQPNRALWSFLSESVLFGALYIVWLRSSKSASHLNGQPRCWKSAFVTGVEMSVLSPINLGYRDYNAARVLAQKIHLYSWPPLAGWLRAIVGLQTFFSLFLLMMWISTVIGDPFG